MASGEKLDFAEVRQGLYETALGGDKQTMDSIIVAFLEKLARESKTRADAKRCCRFNLVGFTIRRKGFKDRSWVFDTIMSCNEDEISEFKQADVKWGENEILTPQMRRYLKTLGFSCGILQVEGDLYHHCIIYRSMVDWPFREQGLDTMSGLCFIF